MMTNLKGYANALYLHIPFCKSICHYCDFKKMVYNESFFLRYFNEIKQQLNDEVLNTNLDTIYIGGGTPTCIGSSNLIKVLDLLAKYSINAKEYTIESNIENINQETLDILKKYGVNRLSLGVQSLNPNLLKLMNRKHLKQDVFNALKLLNENGFNNISIDLIYGFNELTIDNFKADIKQLAKFDNVKHFSIYSLTVEEGTYFDKINYKCTDDEAIYYKIGHDSLEKLGFYQYEVANYSKLNYESKHNIHYWHYDDFYGIGYGASGKINNLRYERLKEVNITKIEHLDAIMEHLMMNLRLLKGINIKSFNKKYKVNLIDLLNEVLVKDKYQGFIEYNDEYLYCTKKGLIILHDILVDIFESVEKIK